jgi:hypothetical protein
MSFFFSLTHQNTPQDSMPALRSDRGVIELNTTFKIKSKVTGALGKNLSKLHSEFTGQQILETCANSRHAPFSVPNPKTSDMPGGAFLSAYDV